MKYRDHNGLIWTRSEDGSRVTCENGISVIGLPYMTAEHMISCAYPDDPGFTLEPIS